jgi:hypothetical protein
MHTQITKKQQKPSLYNKYTDWDAFREILDKHITTKIPLKSKTDIEEAVANLTEGIQQVAQMATPPPRPQHATDSCRPHIRRKLMDKRKARRRWQTTRAPEAKQTYNTHAKELNIPFIPTKTPLSNSTWKS